MGQKQIQECNKEREKVKEEEKKVVAAGDGGKGADTAKGEEEAGRGRQVTGSEEEDGDVTKPCVEVQERKRGIKEGRGEDGDCG